MAFAIFYNREDTTRIVAEFTRADLPNGRSIIRAKLLERRTQRMEHGAAVAAAPAAAG